MAGVWYYWTDCTTTSTSTTTANDVWVTWVSATASTDATTAATSDIVWTTWATTDTQYVTPVRNEVADRRQRERAKQDHAERTRNRRVANLKAMRLLRKTLTDEQWAQLKVDGFFEVIGVSGKKYELHKNTVVGNVVQVDFRQRKRMCAHPKLYEDGSELPMADVLVAQKLALENLEDDFLAVANMQ